MLSPRQLVLLAAAFFFSAYSQITGLMLCVVTGGFLLFLLWRYQSAGPYWQGNLWRMGLTYALVSTPLILAPWGLLVILRQVASSADYGRQVVAVLGGSLWRGLLETVLRFGWGSTVLGAVLALVALGAATFRFVISRDARGLWLLVITAGLVTVFAIARSAAGALYEARYMSWLLPFYLMAIAHGLDWPFTLNVKQPPVCVLARPVQFAALALIFICAYPAYLYTQLTGNPTPYWDLVKWADSNFPRGTLVLVDRWFEPWNELAVHRSTNVYFTFTVPNEPLETFLRNRWRDTAKAFFEKFPDAAYLEIAKTYYDVPEVGPWEWPRTHFARHHAITNEAGLKLRKLGLGHRGDFYAPNTNRVVVEFFYNTKEDLISRWREEGRNAVVLFGAGWGYAKPWQQTGDFRDWRILQDAAVLELYNLTDHACPMTLTICGTSIGSTKRVVASTGHTRDFGVGRYETWLLDLPVLPPGTNLITLADAARPRADSMLFVDRITLTAKSEER